MPEPKMKKCRNCGKDVKVDDEQDPDYTHDCGYSEFKFQHEVRKQELLDEIRREREEERKKKKKSTNPFGL